MAATVALPFTKLGAEFFHFVRPSWAHLGLLCLIVVAYFLATEFVKNLYYRYLDQS